MLGLSALATRPARRR